MKTIQVDPIMAEVHAIRDEYAAGFGYDVGKMFRDLRARQKTSDRKYTCYPARRPSIDLTVPRHQDARETRGQESTQETEGPCGPKA